MSAGGADGDSDGAGANAVPSAWRARLAEARGSKRIEALLAADDAKELVAALPPRDLYQLVHEAGFSDAHDLIALATPEQLRGCVDFDAWHGDRFLVMGMRPWLTSMLELGYEKVGEFWAGLDGEMRALFLARHCKAIYDLTLGEEPVDDEELGPLITPDRFFALKLSAPDDESLRQVKALVDDLYKADADLARHTIMAARAEVGAELEEDALRWRQGRLADLGFIPVDEALQMFAPLTLDKITVDEHTADLALSADDVGYLPIPALEEVLRRSFLARAIGRIADTEHATRIEAALVLIVNGVLSAAGARPDHPEVLRRAGAYAAATVSLGLESVSRGDLARAEAALRSVAPSRLFRAGHTITQSLGRLAKALLPRAQTAGEPARDVCVALALPRPLLARCADRPPMPGLRPIESSDDVRRLSEVLSQLTARIALAEGLGVNLVAMAELPEPRAALDDHIRTAIARMLGGGTWAGHALSAEEVHAVRAFCRAGIPAHAVARVEAEVAAALARADARVADPHVHSLCVSWCRDLELLLGAITDDVADPRFLEGLLVDRPRD